MNRLLKVGVVVLTFLLVIAVGCNQINLEKVAESLFDPPRIAKQTEQARQLFTTPFATDNIPLSATNRVVPTPEPPLITIKRQPVVAKETVVVWFNELSDEHRIAVEKIGTSFTENTEIHLEVVYVDSDNLLTLARAANLTGRLPDIIFHDNNYSGSLLAENIIDPLLANSLINQLNPDTFMNGILQKMPAIDGNIATIPTDGWQQLLLYRADWFAAAALDIPNNYQAITAGAAATHKLVNTKNYDDLLASTKQNVSGLVIPTESDLQETQYIFEHLAVANGCQLEATNKQITLQQPACLAALDFYYDVVNRYSPPGYQTAQSAIQAYLDGRTGMIITSPAMLPLLAGYDERYQPSCQACVDDPLHLVKNTQFVTEITGTTKTGIAANFHHINTIGITSSAQKIPTEQFITFWFEEAYREWLAVSPETKVPLRLTNNSNTVDWLQQWKTLPMSGNTDQSLNLLFGETLSNQLVDGLATSERWGNEENNGLLITHIYEQLLLAPRLQRMLSNFTRSDQTLDEITNALLTAAPDYQQPETIIDQ